MLPGSSGQDEPAALSEVPGLQRRGGAGGGEAANAGGGHPERSADQEAAAAGLGFWFRFWFPPWLNLLRLTFLLLSVLLQEVTSPPRRSRRGLTATASPQ